MSAALDGQLDAGIAHKPLKMFVLHWIHVFCFPKLLHRPIQGALDGIFRRFSPR